MSLREGCSCASEDATGCICATPWAGPHEHSPHSPCRRECDGWQVEALQDAIDHPHHYTWLPGIECGKVAGHFPYNLGTAIAYIWRADYKGEPVKDLKKAIKHLEMELERRCQS